MQRDTLIDAVYNGDKETVRLLLQQGVDVRFWSEHGANLLESALFKRDIEMVCLLLDHGADVNATDDHNSTPLMSAVQTGRVDIVRLLLERGAEVNHSNHASMTALKLAAWNDGSDSHYLDILRILLDAGTEVDFIGEDDHAKPALMFAVDENNLTAVQLLVEAGADVNLTCKNGDTAWNRALREGYTEIADFLERSGAVEVAQVRSDLHTAILWNRVEYVRRLLEQGADSNAKNERGWTALMVAAWWRCDLEILRLLLAYGADINATDEEGDTALMVAAKRGTSYIVRFLIAEGADVNKATAYGETALLQASDGANVESIRALLEAGADVNATETWDGYSSLIQAAYHGTLEAVRFLILYGANVNARTRTRKDSGYYGGCTALLAAVKHGDINFVQLLLL